ncbi:MAG: hypothetical protein BGO89_02495 [Candidatus Kapaibacterium thiocyanatum]|uniref:TraB/GumN family protein n=1 Tax=Candidatus Kapaibacterium thiocyanatum TaxID=1895771 RepID=A0A1M3L2G9_9BACT|nr:MAG: hypothetical protein BGO89_02495 ['Candidatus Kapabacteria' thiocyanatum]
MTMLRFSMMMICTICIGCAGTGMKKAATPPSLLWRVQVPDGTQSYVFGTIHVRDSSIFMQRDSILILMQRCKDLYAELNLDSAASSLDPSAMMIPGGKTLKDLYSPADYDLIMKALKEKLGPMAVMADMLKPAAIVALLSLDGMETTADQGMDEFLWSEARRRGLDGRSLETVDEQLSALDAMPNEMLTEFVKSMGEQDSSSKALLKAYIGEDLSSIDDQMKELDAYGQFSAAINTRRNARMADRLQAVMRSKPVFVAVGAAHLPGSKGLLAELRERGFLVSPVLGGRRLDIRTMK